MNVPDNIREIVDQLGTALAKALSDDEDTRALAKEIQDRGFDVVLMLEVAMTLHKRDDSDHDVISSENAAAFKLDLVRDNNSFCMSAEDRAFLKAFRISAE
jgi:hypothetical protein